MEDLSERLFAHFVAGRWRVPFGTEQLPVHRADGTVAGAVVLAEMRDFSRAQDHLHAADRQAQHRAAQALAGFGMADAVAQARGTSRPVLLSAGVTDPQALGAALGAGLSGGLIWCPPPEAALVATALARQLHEADLPPGCFALIHAYTPRTAALIRTTGLLHLDQ